MKPDLLRSGSPHRATRQRILIAINSIADYARFYCACAFFVLISGCATGPNANPNDPFEPYNRRMSTFNEAVDEALLKPVATGYRFIVPSPVRTGVTNFYNNLQDGWTFVNSVLQLRPQKAVDSLMRFAVNTGLGLGGLLDIATEVGIERHNEDLGKTLGRWGVPSGPYLVFPLLGPSTVRDAFTLTTELKYDPIGQISDPGVRNPLNILRLVNTRANLLRFGNVLDEAALDKYTFTRDAFMARRRAAVARSAGNGKDEDAEDTEKGFPEDKPGKSEIDTQKEEKDK